MYSQSGDFNFTTLNTSLCHLHIWAFKSQVIELQSNKMYHELTQLAERCLRLVFLVNPRLHWSLSDRDLLCDALSEGQLIRGFLELVPSSLGALTS